MNSDLDPQERISMLFRITDQNGLILKTKNLESLRFMLPANILFKDIGTSGSASAPQRQCTL